MALLGQDKTEEATKWIMEAAKYMPEGDTQCATALQQVREESRGTGAEQRRGVGGAVVGAVAATGSGARA